jgi:hypothetical protein
MAAAPSHASLAPDHSTHNRIGHHTPNGVLYYCYAHRADDDIAQLLIDRRERTVIQSLMAVHVSQELHKTMDTGIRVNRALASALGVDTNRSATTPPQVDPIAQSAWSAAHGLSVRSRAPLSPAERTEQCLSLVGVVWE